MALKILNSGYIEIKTKKDAVEALTRFHNLKAEIDAVKEESGLNELEKDATAYKAALQSFMTDKELDSLQGEGFHGTLVKSFGDPRWIADVNDLSGDEATTVVPLAEVIEAKFKSKIATKGSQARKVWMKMTKRVIDPEAIDDLVNDGTLDADEISSSFVEAPRQPYLRVFNDA